MSWVNPNSPNLTDFTSFIYDGMQIPTSALPIDSPWIQYAFNRALNLVLYVPTVAGNDYTITVYNCGGHILLDIAPDQPGQTYFADARQQFGLNSIFSGVNQTASDQGTAASNKVPEQLGDLTIGDLNFLLTPWGRAYISYAQDFGSLSGLS